MSDGEMNPRGLVDKEERFGDDFPNLAERKFTRIFIPTGLVIRQQDYLTKCWLGFIQAFTVLLSISRVGRILFWSKSGLQYHDDIVSVTVLIPLSDIESFLLTVAFLFPLYSCFWLVCFCYLSVFIPFMISEIHVFFKFEDKFYEKWRKSFV